MEYRLSTLLKSLEEDVRITRKIGQKYIKLAKLLIIIMFKKYSS